MRSSAEEAFGLVIAELGTPGSSYRGEDARSGPAANLVAGYYGSSAIGGATEAFRSARPNLIRPGLVDQSWLSAGRSLLDFSWAPSVQDSVLLAYESHAIEPVLPLTVGIQDSTASREGRLDFKVGDTLVVGLTKRHSGSANTAAVFHGIVVGREHVGEPGDYFVIEVAKRGGPEVVTIQLNDPSQDVTVEVVANPVDPSHLSQERSSYAD